MNKFKESKGITLIALVITIIVLLILVGVVLVSLTGQNGVLTRAKSSTAQNAYYQAEEQARLALASIKTDISVQSVQTEDYDAKTRATEFATDLKNKELSDSKWTVEGNNTTGKIKITYKDKAVKANSISEGVPAKDGQVNFTISLLKDDAMIVLPNNGGINYGGKDPSTLTTGDTITIGDEQFMVLKNQNDIIMAMPYYNITLDTSDPKQITDGTEADNLTAFSGMRYWGNEKSINVDMNNGTNKVKQYIDAYSRKLSNLTGGRAVTDIGKWYATDDFTFNLSPYNNITNAENKKVLNPSGLGDFWIGSIVGGSNYLRR